MFSQVLTIFDSAVFTVVSLILASVFGMFLYWRTARRELVENQTIFDTVALFLTGSFIGGRLVDFAVRSDFYGWSVKKLIFFNAFWGFDVYGALIGGVLAVWVYLRVKREKFWDIFDYAAEGLAFGAFLFFALTLLRFEISLTVYKLGVIYAVGYLLIFWTVKRLAKFKRHRGFFTCLFFLTSALLNLIVLAIEGQYQLTQIWWLLSFSVFSALIFSVNWYLLAKRRFFADIKSFFGFVLLSVFKTFRILTSLREADSVAKVIVLSPLLLAKSIYNLVKYLGREIYLSFVDLFNAFGVRK